MLENRMNKTASNPSPPVRAGNAHFVDEHLRWLVWMHVADPRCHAHHQATFHRDHDVVAIVKQEFPDERLAGGVVEDTLRWMTKKIYVLFGEHPESDGTISYHC